MQWVDKLLANIAKSNILVYGDVMLDQYWLGDVKRISPEAPVPIVSVLKENERLGGAANVANNIVALGGQCTLLGRVGDDQAAERLFSLLSVAGINNQVQQDNKISTLRKLRVMANNQQLLRVDFEKEIDTVSSNQVFEVFKQQIAHHDAVIFSDYGKGCLRQISEAISYAKQCGKVIFVDPKGQDFSIYRGASLITPNLAEFETIVGNTTDNDDIVRKAKQMLIEYDIDQILVTLSERGMILISNDADPVYVAAKTKEVYDVSGAGDTVIATLAATMCDNHDAEQVLLLANLIAGIVISKLGTSVPSLDELHQKIAEN